LSRPSVTSHLTGGCANQIFQYAAGLALARRLGVSLQLDISAYDSPDQHRHYSLDLFAGVDAPLVRTLSGEVIREEGLSYKPALFEKAPRKCSLVGYWQSENYFFPLRHELSRRLSPRQPLPSFQREIERQIRECGDRSVLLHVRRTDYVGNPFHLVLPMDYYRNAASLIAATVPDPVFFVFSDDQEWCRANLHLPYRTIVAEDADHTPQNGPSREDASLWLMRQCRHAIIANSSFSWWGAWLGPDANGGIVLAPKNWVGAAWKDEPPDVVPGRWARVRDKQNV
jgi:hypothetical protein